MTIKAEVQIAVGEMEERLLQRIDDAISGHLGSEGKEDNPFRVPPVQHWEDHQWTKETREMLSKTKTKLSDRIIEKIVDWGVSGGIIYGILYFSQHPIVIK